MRDTEARWVNRDNYICNRLSVTDTQCWHYAPWRFFNCTPRSDWLDLALQSGARGGTRRKWAVCFFDMDLPVNTFFPGVSWHMTSWGLLPLHLAAKISFVYFKRSGQVNKTIHLKIWFKCENFCSVKWVNSWKCGNYEEYTYNIIATFKYAYSAH